MKVNINSILGKPTFLYEKFQNKIKIKNKKEIMDPKYWPENWVKIFYKAYPRLKEIKLGAPALPSSISLRSSLLNRQSTREFSQKPITRKKLSSLLYFSTGLNKVNNAKHITRFYPSAGSRFPIECYLVALNCNIPSGVYHYNVKCHSLEQLRILTSFEFDNYFSQDWIKNSSAIFLLSAIFNRNTIKYGNRGYRLTLIESGHIGQNISLVATALNMGYCPIGGFLDDNLNELLDLDGLDESIIYAFALGELITS